MTLMTVPAASIAGMVFSLVVSFALPIGLFIYAKKKLGAKAAPFFIGCGVFFVMVVMLEAAIHRIVFQLAGEALTGSVILYAVYGGLMAWTFRTPLCMASDMAVWRQCFCAAWHPSATSQVP